MAFQVRVQGREVLIYGDIGLNPFAAQSVEARDVIDALEDMPGTEPIIVRVNSYGGAYADGVAIYNALVRHAAPVHVQIEGYAYSMGSYIAMAGELIRMPENAMLMIHAPLAWAEGNAADLEETAENLRRHAAAMAGAYRRGGKVDGEAVDHWLSGEKDFYFTAQEAQAAGLVDEISGALAVAASANLAALRSTQPKGEPMRDEKQIAAAAEKDVLERMQEIEAALSLPITARIPTETIQAIRAEALQGKLDVKGVQTRLLEALPGEEPITAGGSDAALGAANGGHSVGEIRMGADAREKMRDGMEEALLFRARLDTSKEIAASVRQNEFMGMSLHEMARHCLIQQGIPVRGMNRSQIVGRALTVRGDLGITHTSSDFPALLENALNKAVLKGWEETEETWRMIAAPGSIPDFKPAPRSAIGEYPTLPKLKENGEFTYATVGDRKETIVLLTYGSIIGLGRNAIVNDDLNQFQRLGVKQGRAAARLVGDLVYFVLTSNPNMEQDGIPLFDAQHNNIATVAGPPSVETLDNMRYKMALQKDTDQHAHGLNLPLQRVIVPKSLETVADVLRAATDNPDNVGDRSPNPFANRFEVVSDPRLDADSTVQWYTSTNPDGFDVIEVGFLEGQQSPYMESKDGWTVDGIEMKVRMDCAAAPMDFRTMCRNPGA